MWSTARNLCFNKSFKRNCTISTGIPKLGVSCEKWSNWTSSVGVGQKIPTPTPSVVRKITPPRIFRLQTTATPQTLQESSDFLRSRLQLICFHNLLFFDELTYKINILSLRDTSGFVLTFLLLCFYIRAFFVLVCSHLFLVIKRSDVTVCYLPTNRCLVVPLWVFLRLYQGFPTLLRSRTTWAARIVKAYHFFQNN